MEQPARGGVCRGAGYAPRSVADAPARSNRAHDADRPRWRERGRIWQRGTRGCQRTGCRAFGGGTLIAEYDGGISPRVGDLVACSTAETCPSAPQIARIRRIDRWAGVVEVQPMNRALERASVRFDAKPEDGLTVDGVVVAAYAPVYVRGEDGGAWWSVGGGRG